MPPFAHGEVEERLAGAGVALFVEKPLGLDVATAQRVHAAVAAAGVSTSVGHHWRSSTVVARAREVLAGRIVRLVGVTWLDKVPPVPWWAHRGSSGGQVVEQAVHVLDLARVLAGEVVVVHAVADAAPPAGGDVDSATAGALRFADGAVGTLVRSAERRPLRQPLRDAQGRGRTLRMSDGPCLSCGPAPWLNGRDEALVSGPRSPKLRLRPGAPACASSRGS